MFTARNDAYQLKADFKNFGYVRVFDAKGAHAADQKNVVIADLSLERRRAESTQFLSMSRVVAGRAPFEVGDHVISAHGINVVDNRKVVWVGDESDCHKSVHAKCGRLAILSQNDPWVSAVTSGGCVNLRTHDCAAAALNVSVSMDNSAVHASDSAEVTDFVEPFVSYDGSPFFSESDIHMTGCPSGELGSTIKSPSYAATFGGLAIMAPGSAIYNRSHVDAG